MSSTLASDTPQGLLYICGECGPHVTEEEFNDWYDNEHAPARLTVKGINNALLYKASDSHKDSPIVQYEPFWLALYDISTPEIIASDEYKTLDENASQREIDIVNRLRRLHRRVYKHYSTLEHPGVQLPAKYLLVASIEPKREREDEFNKWYEEEHMVLLSKVPGWLRGRRYTLSSQTELAGMADKTNPMSATSYVAIHELDRPDFLEQQEFQTAINTPWTNRVVDEVVWSWELRVFELHKDVGSSQ